MTTDASRPAIPWPTGAVIPIDHAPSIRSPEPTDARLRHDNPHWPVRSPGDAADALRLHDDCPWHCSTRVAALIVSRDDYQYFRRRGHTESDSWTTHSE